MHWGVPKFIEGGPTVKAAVMEKQTIPATLVETALFKGRNESSTIRDIGLLALRLTMGGLLAGHGSQKLFGWFSGPGLKGTAGWLESMGLKPGTPWATVASASEFGGGTLTALGLLHPLGPIGTMGGMVMATAKAHWGKPIWVTQGGAELPVTNLAIALALTLSDPGRFSLDQVLGIRVPRMLVVTATIVEAVLVIIGITRSPAPAPAPPVERPTTATASADQSAGIH
jgi:putative oxidoreductase